MSLLLLFAKQSAFNKGYVNKSVIDCEVPAWHVRGQSKMSKCDRTHSLLHK